jgi:DNA-binding CsgD family transcriptional regulator
MRLLPMTETPQLLTVDDALGAGSPLLALKAHALSAVVALVPASLLVFLTLSRRRTLQDAVALQTEQLRISLRELWLRYLAEARHRDPFGSERVTSGAVVAGLQAVDADAAYMTFLRDTGVRDSAVMYLRASGTVVAAISLLRSERQPPFTRREEITLRRVQPLVQHAYAAAVLPATNGMRGALRDSGLTEREAQVAELVGRGATNVEIARTLHVSDATIKTHLRHIYAKVGVTSRTQLAILVSGDPGHG